jgi:hypothetical protein
MRYNCEKCGKIHDHWPALAFDSPYYYNILSDKDKEEIAELNDDFCVIKYETQTDFFIRVVLNQLVNDSCQDLPYGLWVTLSEKNFQEYSEYFSTGNQDKVYFGFLSNVIEGYDHTLNLKMNVVVKKGSNRPEIVPHEDQLDNTFVKDYYEGITITEAKRRIKHIVERSVSETIKDEKKSWWKFW